MADTPTPPSRPRPLAVAALVAALAVIVGLVLAGREISQQEYLAHGLRRTALWTATRHTLIPGLWGGVAGLLLALLIARWSALLSALQKAAGLAPLGGSRSAASSPAVFRFVLFIALCSAAAAWLVPMESPQRLHPPYIFVAVACFAAAWLLIGLLAAATLPGLSRDDEPAVWFRLHWFALIGLAYVVILLRAWSRDAKPLDNVLFALGGLVACIIAYHGLHLPLRLLTRAVAPALGRISRVTFAVARVLAFVVVGFALILWVASWAAGFQARAQARQRGLNVILIGVDTLRYDRVSLLSADERDRDLTPNLRTKLAARGTVWTNAISQAPWTLPAVASIFTGLYPEQHGAALVASQLGPDQTTLAELLRNAGYHTMGAVSALNVSSHVGMHQGFTDFHECGDMDNYGITSDQVTTTALRFLKDRPRDPFFLLAYYFDPHFNYRNHPEPDFADEYDGWFLPQARSENQIFLLRQKRDLLGPREHDFVRNLYDEEIAHTDHHIGRLLDYLDEAGLWDSTLVIFFADHGEEFFERGWIGHSITVFQELVHVPLVTVIPPGTKHGVVDQPVETRWLFDTVLDFLGLDPPRGRDRGPSLLAGAPPNQPFMRSSTRYVLREQDLGTTGVQHVYLSCLVGSRWKLINDHITQKVTLFDLQEDPLEARDLSADQPEVQAELSRVLRARNADTLRGAPGTRAPRVTDETIRRLKSLGYL